jgi:alcohol dehydrogenase (NADP+)
VGIIGIGGIGHFGIDFAKALGAQEVVAISRRANKKGEALQLGADRYIATEDEPNWAEKHARSLDIIVSTVSSANVSSIIPSAFLPFRFLMSCRCQWTNTSDY